MKPSLMSLTLMIFSLTMIHSGMQCSCIRRKISQLSFSLRFTSTSMKTTFSSTVDRNTQTTMITIFADLSPRVMSESSAHCSISANIARSMILFASLISTMFWRERLAMPPKKGRTCLRKKLLQFQTPFAICADWMVSQRQMRLLSESASKTSSHHEACSPQMSSNSCWIVLLKMPLMGLQKLSKQSVWRLCSKGEEPMVSLRLALEDWIFADFLMNCSYFRQSQSGLLRNFSMAPLAITLLMPLLSMKVNPSSSNAAKASRLATAQTFSTSRMAPMPAIVESRMVAGRRIMLVISLPTSIFLMRLLRLAEEVASRISSSVASELRFSMERKLPEVEEYCESPCTPMRWFFSLRCSNRKRVQSTYLAISRRSPLSIWIRIETSSLKPLETFHSREREKSRQPTTMARITPPKMSPMSLSSRQLRWKLSRMAALICSALSRKEKMQLLKSQQFTLSRVLCGQSSASRCSVMAFSKYSKKMANWSKVGCGLAPYSGGWRGKQGAQEPGWLMELSKMRAWKYLEAKLAKSVCVQAMMMKLCSQELPGCTCWMLYCVFSMNAAFSYREISQYSLVSTVNVDTIPSSTSSSASTSERKSSSESRMKRLMLSMCAMFTSARLFSSFRKMFLEGKRMTLFFFLLIEKNSCMSISFRRFSSSSRLLSSPSPSSSPIRSFSSRLFSSSSLISTSKYRCPSISRSRMQISVLNLRKFFSRRIQWQSSRTASKGCSFLTCVSSLQWSSAACRSVGRKSLMLARLSSLRSCSTSSAQPSPSARPFTIVPCRLKQFWLSSFSRKSSSSSRIWPQRRVYFASMGMRARRLRPLRQRQSPVRRRSLWWRLSVMPSTSQSRLRSMSCSSWRLLLSMAMYSTSPPAMMQRLQNLKQGQRQPRLVSGQIFLISQQASLLLRPSRTHPRNIGWWKPRTQGGISWARLDPTISCGSQSRLRWKKLLTRVITIFSSSHRACRQQVFCSNSIIGLYSSSFSVVLSTKQFPVRKIESYSTLFPKSSIAAGFTFSFRTKTVKQMKQNFHRRLMGKQWLMVAHCAETASRRRKLGRTILRISRRWTSLKERQRQKSSLRASTTSISCWMRLNASSLRITAHILSERLYSSRLNSLLSAVRQSLSRTSRSRWWKLRYRCSNWLTRSSVVNTFFSFRQQNQTQSSSRCTLSGCSASALSQRHFTKNFTTDTFPCAILLIEHFFFFLESQHSFTFAMHSGFLQPCVQWWCITPRISQSTSSSSSAISYLLKVKKTLRRRSAQEGQLLTRRTRSSTARKQNSPTSTTALTISARLEEEEQAVASRSKRKATLRQKQRVTIPKRLSRATRCRQVVSPKLKQHPTSRSESSRCPTTLPASCPPDRTCAPVTMQTASEATRQSRKRQEYSRDLQQNSSLRSVMFCSRSVQQSESSTASTKKTRETASPRSAKAKQLVESSSPSMRQRTQANIRLPKYHRKQITPDPSLSLWKASVTAIAASSTPFTTYPRTAMPKSEVVKELRRGCQELLKAAEQASWQESSRRRSQSRKSAKQAREAVMEMEMGRGWMRQRRERCSLTASAFIVFSCSSSEKSCR